MFLALKITQAVLKYNDIHWTIVWKDNSVQGGYSSSSCTQRLEGKCKGFSVLDMCTIQSLFKKNDVTQGRFHLHIKICSFMSAEPARQKKKSIQNAHIKIPLLVFLDMHCLLNSIDHGKFKSARISIVFTHLFSSFSSSSRPWHSLTCCISKYYKLSHKRSLNQFPYGLSVLHVFPRLLSFNSYYFFFPSVFTLLPSTLPSVAVVETHVDSFVLISIILLLVVFYFIMNCWTSTIYSFLQSMWRSRQVPESWHCKLKAQFQLQYPWLKLLKCISI